MPKNKQSNLIANVKMSNIGFIQQVYYKLRNKGGGYSVLVNYQLLLSNIFPLPPPPPNYFSLQNIDKIEYSVLVLLKSRILWFTSM